LGLKRICKLGASLLVVHEWPERTLNLIVERDHEGVAGDEIGTAVEEKLHHFPVPSEQHILQWDGLKLRTVLNKHFDHIETLTLYGFGKCSVLLVLPLFVTSEQFNEAVETSIDGHL